MSGAPAGPAAIPATGEPHLRATVFGAAGFVGRHLVADLAARGWEVRPVVRGDERWRDHDLGHVFYCIGLTANFRTRPFDTVDAHVGMLAEVLRHGRFASLVYLSSTRVYAAAASTREATPIPVEPADPGDLYDISKLLGEALCLSRPDPAVRVARLSNVYGADMGPTNFVGSLVRDAVADGRILLGQDLASEKDYVSIGYVTAALAHIAAAGRHRIYNVAAGRNVSHAAIVERISALTGADVAVAPGAPVVRFDSIIIERLVAEVGEDSDTILDRLTTLVDSTRGFPSNKYEQ